MICRIGRTWSGITRIFTGGDILRMFIAFWLWSRPVGVVRVRRGEWVLCEGGGGG